MSVLNLRIFWIIIKIFRGLKVNIMSCSQYVGEINYDVFCDKAFNKTKYGIYCIIECGECKKKAYQNKLWSDDVMSTRRDKRSGASAGAKRRHADK